MFIDEWFDPFYEKLPSDFRVNHRFGQIFWTHAYYPHENLQIWRPVEQDSTEPLKTMAHQFRIQAAGADAFKRSMPLHTPALKSREEFIVIKAKRRPVILAQSCSPFHSGENRGYKAKFSRQLCLVALCFGIVDKDTNRTKFDPALIDRIRAMEFPQVMFLPQSPGVFEGDGMVRLDQMQSVFAPHLEPTQFSLVPDLRDVLKDQLRAVLLGDSHYGIYADLREELLKDQKTSS